MDRVFIVRLYIFYIAELAGLPGSDVRRKDDGGGMWMDEGRKKRFHVFF